MAESKTKPTEVTADAFIEAVEDPVRRADAKVVRAMMERLAGEPGRMWGPSIVGFGSYRYRTIAVVRGRRAGWASPRARRSWCSMS